MPKEKNITTQELDSIARLGFDDLRSCLSSNPPEGAADRAEMALKVLGHSNRRMSSETNRASLVFRIGRTLGATADELRPFWKQISGASGEAETKTTSAIEPAKSKK